MHLWSNNMTTKGLKNIWISENAVRECIDSNPIPPKKHYSATSVSDEVICWETVKQTFVPKGSHLKDKKSWLELCSLLPRWSPPGSEWSQTLPLAGPEDRSATKDCLHQSWRKADIWLVQSGTILCGLSILVADDERPKKECSVGLAIKLGSNTQLFLVVVDLLSLLRCHLQRLLQRYIYQKTVW